MIIMKLRDLPRTTEIFSPFGGEDRVAHVGSRFTKEELKRAELIVGHLEGLTINSARELLSKLSESLGDIVLFTLSDIK